MRAAFLLLFAFSASADVFVRESLTGLHVREIRVPRCIVWDGPLRPFTCDRVPLFFNAAQPARVFDPNPVVVLNDPSLRDENDSANAVPPRAYSDATVDLLGPNVRILEQQAPATTLPDPNAPLTFDRGDDRFEPVNAAFHVDRLQRYLQSLGYAGSRQLVPYAIEVDPLVATGADTSFFVPSFTQPGRGALYYGVNGTDDAEDGDIVVHEYGHAILEWIAPGTYGGAYASEARAFSEAFGDYLAFSAHYERRLATGRDAFCFADWDARCWTDAASEGCGYPAGSDCLRRLDSANTMADYRRIDSPGAEHRNALIFSSALREIFLKLGRRTTDVLLIESLFDAPPNPTYAVMARRLIETDQLLNGGVNRDVICAAMTARGIAVSCDGAPRGEFTYVPSSDRGIIIPDRDPNGIVSRLTVSDPRLVERLGVRIDLDHSARGDLRIELIAPDGTRVLLQDLSNELAEGIHTTYEVDAFHGRSASGTWELRIADFRSRDVGTLRSWALVIQFAGDEPQSQRPRASKTQMLPVVAHLYGAGITPYVSDVNLANVTASAQTATLIFTRSGEDGTTHFSAVDVQLAPGQSATVEDIVAGTFLTAGSGSLEILGDVLVTSRLYTTLPNGGTLGQEVPANAHSSSDSVFVAGLVTGNMRYNLGITETSGVRTRVVINDDREVIVEPFSHVQIPFIDRALLRPAGGSITAYISQIDVFSGDPMLVPAQRPGDFAQIVPAIYDTGANRIVWRTDFWIASDTSFRATYRGFTITGTGPRSYFDAVREAFSFPFTTGPLFIEAPHAYTRVYNGTTSQFIPLRTLDDRREQHLIGLSANTTHRTNIGIVSDSEATAEVLVYDAAGTEVERHLLVTNRGIAQTNVVGAITGGRALVRVLGGRGRAYASVIDNRSKDAAFVDFQ